MRCASLVAALLVCTAPVLAGAINTDTALSVGKGTVVSRTQLRYSDPEQSIDRYLARQTFAYGITGRLSAFASLAHIWNRPGPDGLTNLALFGRYTLYARDAHRQTLTFSGIAGVEVPIGSRPMGGGDTGLILGAVGTWFKNLWEINADLVWTWRPDRGDLLRSDLAVARTLVQGERWQLVAVLEANYRRAGDNGVLFLSPGLQAQFRGVMFETSLQVRVAEDSLAPVADFVLVLSVRFVF